jgi:hypothetical protein
MSCGDGFLLTGTSPSEAARERDVEDRRAGRDQRRSRVVEAKPQRVLLGGLADDAAERSTPICNHV